MIRRTAVETLGDPELALATERRAVRLQWPIRRYQLGEEPSDDLSGSTTASERLAMVWPLSASAWRLAGREIPSYERAEMPGRVTRASVDR